MQKILLRPISKNVLVMLSSGSFMVSRPICMSSIYFKLIFVHGIRKQLVWDFACICPVVPTSFIEEGLFRIVYFCLLYHRLIDHINVGLSLFSLFSFIHYLSLCQYQTVLIIVNLEYSLKSRRMIPPALFFIIKIVLDLQGPSFSIQIL